MLTTLMEARPETLEQRRDALDEIMHHWDDITPSARARKLREITTLRGEARRVAVQTLREAIYDADALESGEMMWDQYEPDLAEGLCDRQHQAQLIARGQVYAAMTVLLRDPVVTP